MKRCIPKIQSNAFFSHSGNFILQTSHSKKELKLKTARSRATLTKQILKWSSSMSTLM